MSENTAWPGHAAPLGVTHDGLGVNVAVWSDGAESVEFCVFDANGAERRFQLAEHTFHVFHGYIPGVDPGAQYGFRVNGPWDPARGLRYNPAKLLIDPYAKAITGILRDHPAAFGSIGDDLTRNDEDSAPYVPRSVITSDGFDWNGDRPPHTSWDDTIIYETHVKGLTARHPKVPQELRGTYAAMAHPAVVDHLVDLGVTAVELLPIHHFVPETPLVSRGLTNYWGYNSIGYFAPHAGYSASGTLGQQVGEFQGMVKALHTAGLEVILDVVYNHTAEGNENGPTLAFRGLDNDDYYRLYDGGRLYTDYTGCGNTLNAAKPHVLQLITDSLRYWVQEMHVDGFRFDLASALARSFHDVDMLGAFLATVQQDPVLREVKLIAEPWDIGAGGYQVGEFPPLWTEWNDKYRDCIRDFWRGQVGAGELGWRLTGSADLYLSEGRRPFASINFVTAHDGFTMRDLVTYEQKHNEANGEDNRDGNNDNRSGNYGAEGETDDPETNRIRHSQVRNLFATLLLSTGVPMITMGDELGRTQGGNNNAYCQDNEISWMAWDLADWQKDLLRFASSVVKLRRDHPVFRQRYFFRGRAVTDEGQKDLAWIGPHGQEMSDDEWNDSGTRTVGMFLSGALRSRDHWGRPVLDSSFLTLLHAGDEPVDFVLPGQPCGQRYRRVVDTSCEEPEPEPRVQQAADTVSMRPRTLMVFEVID
ncbi:MAG: glycogen debranching protein GlgX [Candidatus Nanopelagicales bacterium]|nr:glycogen debranching protein GlgX [Candidatus Nanopelagicales bacterium]MDZ4250157.1 glycogen debranching protein GlgX [Candidatus Nanopelagicales bacterium]